MTIRDYIRRNKPWVVFAAVLSIIALALAYVIWIQ
jgi:hypothetical protein